jgi:hypothetical protein
MEFYNKKIQIHEEVIKDIFQNIKPHTKMLVFGLGHDSKMWYEGNNKNTIFVENKDEYITLNNEHISSNNIIKYNYNITCEKSDKLTNAEIKKFEIPKNLLNHAPFDIILIDGPEGYNMKKPGRLIPCYWATLLSKVGTLIYIDDSSRYLENFCIKKYYSNKIVYTFKERNECTKIKF